MMIRVCAWHRAYFGWPKILGLAFTGQLAIERTDGMCDRCGAKMDAGEVFVPRRSARQREISAMFAARRDS